MTVSAVSFHLFLKAEAASLEGRKGKERKPGDTRGGKRTGRTALRTDAFRTPHLSSARFLAEQLIVLTGAPMAPRQPAKSVRKRALSSCNIRDMAETLLETPASARTQNQQLSCRAPVLRIKGGGQICESAAFSCPGTPSSSSGNFIPSARYALTLSGPWN